LLRHQKAPPISGKKRARTLREREKRMKQQKSRAVAPTYFDDAVSVLYNLPVAARRNRGLLA
jgi:hypothetical protein